MKTRMLIQSFVARLLAKKAGGNIGCDHVRRALPCIHIASALPIHEKWAAIMRSLGGSPLNLAQLLVKAWLARCLPQQTLFRATTRLSRKTLPGLCLRLAGVGQSRRSEGGGGQNPLAQSCEPGGFRPALANLRVAGQVGGGPQPRAHVHQGGSRSTQRLALSVV